MLPTGELGAVKRCDVMEGNRMCPASLPSPGAWRRLPKEGRERGAELSSMRRGASWMVGELPRDKHWGDVV